MVEPPSVLADAAKRPSKTCKNMVSDTASEPAETIVYDTNVIHHSAGALSLFPGANIVLPGAVFAELDRHKTGAAHLRGTARLALAEFLKLSTAHDQKVIDIPRRVGGSVSFREISSDFKWPEGLDPSLPDDRIIATALDLQQKNPSGKLKLISSDYGVVIKARAHGLRSDILRNELNQSTEITDAAGMIAFEISAHQMSTLINKLKEQDQQISISDLPKNIVWPEGSAPYANLVIQLTAPSHEQSLFLKVQFHSENTDQKSPLLVKMHDPARFPRLAISHRNPEQRAALGLMFDQSLDLVTITGEAGTGKTLLALAAALAQTGYDGARFDQIVLIKAPTTVGQDIGYIPGHVDSKLGPLHESFGQALAIIVESLRANQKILLDQKSIVTTQTSSSGRKGKSQGKGTAFNLDELRDPSLSVSDAVDKLLKSPMITHQPLSFIRGMSLRRSVVILDEAQNLTLQEMITALTRIGDDSLIILLGDPAQIDRAHLTNRTNGLVEAAHRLQGLDEAAFIHLSRPERSTFVGKVIERLR
jgi:PhoH-like ATPase